MSTLAEIEAAVSQLTVEELDYLETTLRELRLRRSGEHERPMTNLAQFAGALRLTADPLEWQCRIREEWK